MTRLSRIGRLPRTTSILAVLVATAGLTLMTATPASAAVTFSGPTSFPAGNPISLAAGDFNDDGDPDLAVANYTGSAVSVLLGDGAGSFGPAASFPAGTNPQGVDAGDFDGDGDSDLAIANINGGNVSVLLSDGALSFAPAINYPAGTSPISVVVADFDGDTNPDLAAANHNSANVSVLLGDGTGIFGAQATFAAGTKPYSVAVGDFDGDTNPDLAVANIDGGDVSVLLGDGAGLFGAPNNFVVGPGAKPFEVVVGDLNGDGDLDLVTANVGSNNISVLLGDGAGSFAAPTNFATAGGSAPISVGVADFDGDGNPDVAVSNQTGSDDDVSVLLGDGAGSLGAPTNFVAGLTPFSIVVSDFDGDNDPDLAVANQGSADVSVLLNTTPPAPNPGGSNPGPIQRTLTITESGDGAGSVTGPGIICPGDCTESYADGTEVTLIATATGGSWFAGWSGDCTGYTACQPKMSEDRAVSAAFGLTAPHATRKKVKLTASKDEARSGKRVRLTATVAPCAGHKGELVTLQWGVRSRSASTDLKCKAVFRMRMRNRDMLFQAVSLQQDDDHLAGISLPVRVEVKKAKNH